MSKCYPAIFYPHLILNFLVKKPASTLGKYQHQVSSKQKLGAKKQNIYNSVVPKNSLLTGCKLVFFISLGFLIPLSIALVSPLWLVISVWLSIILGIFCARFFVSAKKSGKKNFSDHRQTSTEVKNATILRLPQREAELHRWIAGKVLQPIGSSDAPTGVSEKAFYQVLQHVFPGIVQGLAFPNPEFSYPYSADFVLVCDSLLSESRYSVRT